MLAGKVDNVADLAQSELKEFAIGTAINYETLNSLANCESYIHILDGKLLCKPTEMDIEKAIPKKTTATSKKNLFTNISHLKPFVSVTKNFISDLTRILDTSALSS